TTRRSPKSRCEWSTALNKELPADLHDPNFVDATRSDQHVLPVACRDNVPQYAAAGRNRRCLELVRLRIKTHDGVGLHVGFAVPDDPVRSRRDSIRLRLRTARRWPLVHLSSRGIQTTEIAARIVGIINAIVRRDGNASRSGAGIRKHELLDLECGGIDAGELVRIELAIIKDAFGI